MANVGYKNYMKYYREFNCIVCGKTAIDMSPGQNRRYCSNNCACKGYRVRHGIGVKPFATPDCVYNDAIECTMRKCSTCGWNPKVEAKRKEALAYGY